MQLHFRPENAHVVAFGERKILVAARSMSLFVMDPVAEAILSTAHATGSELILIGGYGHRPLLEAILGGTVDQVLRESDRPVLICR